jgi:large subunit ribosomal protein L40
MKKWAQYRNEEILRDYQTVDRLMAAQRKALEELKFESEELYQAAIQLDADMIPVVIDGPVNTPPIKDYAFVDGEYINTTKLYQGEVAEPQK